MSEQKTQTLCWDCAKATGGCSWSYNCTPVDRWKAIPKKKKASDGYYDSYVVIECPEFVRDAYRNGLIRVNKGDTNEKVL